MGWTSEFRDERGSETAFFFGRPGHRKYAVLHLPREAVGQPLLVCHPHFEEKLWAHRILLDLARRVVGLGHPVLRFDLSGQGDSEGEFEDFGFDDHERDVDEAWELLRDRTGSDPVLLGLRLGGTLAGRAAARHGVRVALWEPVLDPAAWLYEALRAHLAFQMRQFGRVRTNRNELVRELEAGGTVFIEGYGLTGRFHREASASGGLAEPAFPARCRGILAISVGKQPLPEGAALTRAAKAWRDAVPVEHFHVTDDPFWSDVRRYRTRCEALVAPTLSWLGRDPDGTA